MEKFMEVGLFLEIAMPVFMMCFAPRAKIDDSLVLCIFWGDLRGNIDYYEKNCVSETIVYHHVTFKQKSIEFIIRKSGLSFENNETIMKLLMMDSTKTPKDFEFHFKTHEPQWLNSRIPPIRKEWL